MTDVPNEHGEVKAARYVDDLDKGLISEEYDLPTGDVVIPFDVWCGLKAMARSFSRDWLENKQSAPVKDRQAP